MLVLIEGYWIDGTPAVLSKSVFEKLHEKARG